jgi:predicted MFS family arabinose efflux permease
MSGVRIAVFAIACGLAVGNLYYAQPLLEAIGATFHVGETPAALVVTITQIGYAFGLLALVPLGDLVENRRLIVTILSATVVALACAALAPNFASFLVASLAIGITSVVAQVLVPLAANLAPAESRGRVVGQVMSGLIAGILLARAFAGGIAEVAGWRAVYGVSAVLCAATIVVLARVVPLRRPAYAEGYGALMRSLVTLFRREPVLRRRIVYQAAMFAVFSAFWTTVTFRLAAAPFHLGTGWIGAFALVGAAGAAIAPVAGRLGDAGHGRVVSGLAFAVAAVAFALALVPGNIVTLALAAVAFDVAVQASLVTGQQAIYALDPAARGRLNTLYIGLFFLGGAAGSAGSSAAYARAGWPGVVTIGIVLPLLALAYWSTEPHERGS